MVKNIHSLNYSSSFSRIFSEFESAIKIDLMSADKESKEDVSFSPRFSKIFENIARPAWVLCKLILYLFLKYWKIKFENFFRDYNYKIGISIEYILKSFQGKQKHSEMVM